MPESFINLNFDWSIQIIVARNNPNAAPVIANINPSLKNIFKIKPVFKNESKFDYTQTFAALNTKTNDAKRMGVNM